MLPLRYDFCPLHSQPPIHTPCTSKSLQQFLNSVLHSITGKIQFNIHSVIFRARNLVLEISPILNLTKYENPSGPLSSDLWALGNPLRHNPWWRDQMKTFSALLAICEGNLPVRGEFPAKRPVTRSFDVFFDLRLNKRLRKQSWGWWFETLSRPLCRHFNDAEQIDLEADYPQPLLQQWTVVRWG